MKRKNSQEKRVAMKMAGVLTTNWGMLEKAVLNRGGQYEDLHILGEPENSETVAIMDEVAEKLVACGRASRATNVNAQSVPQQMAFKVGLKPLNLFLIHKNGADAPALLSVMEEKYFVSDLAKGMMKQTKHFIIGRPEMLLVGVYTCDQLGVTDWPETDFFGPKGWERIREFGLAKCLSDDGQYVRLAHPKQELGEWFRVGHDPIPFGGYSSVWDVGHGESGGPYLYGWDLNSSNRLDAGSLVALRLAQ